MLIFLITARGHFSVCSICLFVLFHTGCQSGRCSATHSRLWNKQNYWHNVLNKSYSVLLFFFLRKDCIFFGRITRAAALLFAWSGFSKNEEMSWWNKMQKRWQLHNYSTLYLPESSASGCVQCAEHLHCEIWCAHILTQPHFFSWNGWEGAIAFPKQARWIQYHPPTLVRRVLTVFTDQ